jgi:UDP-N-acetylmuramate--alanine ligase
LNLKEINSVYLIGIGGIGMSALARYFNAQGMSVSGYDRTATSLTDELVVEGIQISLHDNLEAIPSINNDFSLVIYTPAIPQDSIILNYFKNNGYDLYKRSEVLGFITESSYTIGVAGTHGKTTTSSIVAHILTESKVGCNAFLGGIATNYNTNLLIDDNSRNTVVEADEFDRSFLTLVPNIAIVTSTDADHLDIYGGHSELLESFQLYVNKINPKGTLILRAGLDLKFGNTLTYGIDTEADYNAHNLCVDKGNYKFDVQTPNGLYIDVVIGLPGRHNIENALAAIAVAELMGVSKEKIIAGLASFQGVKRRFEKIIDTKDLVYIDDYAHHPKELEMCISSIKELYPNRKVTGIFQPHLFTRTRDFADEFAKSLSLLNELLLLDIYPARELPIDGINSEMLLAKVDLETKEIVSKSNVVERLETRELDILLTLGAGDIDTIVQPIKKAFSV